MSDDAVNGLLLSHSPCLLICIWTQAIGLPCPLFLSAPWGPCDLRLFLLLLSFPEWRIFEAPFWSRASVFPQSPVYWLGLNTSRPPSKHSPSLPWRYSSKHNPQEMPVITKTPSHQKCLYNKFHRTTSLFCYNRFGLRNGSQFWLHLRITGGDFKYWSNSESWGEAWAMF